MYTSCVRERISSLAWSQHELRSYSAVPVRRCTQGTHNAARCDPHVYSLGKGVCSIFYIPGTMRCVSLRCVSMGCCMWVSCLRHIIPGSSERRRRGESERTERPAPGLGDGRPPSASPRTCRPPAEPKCPGGEGGANATGWGKEKRNKAVDPAESCVCFRRYAARSYHAEPRCSRFFRMDAVMRNCRASLRPTAAKTMSAIRMMGEDVSARSPAGDMPLTKCLNGVRRRVARSTPWIHGRVKPIMWHTTARIMYESYRSVAIGPEFVLNLEKVPHYSFCFKQGDSGATRSIESCP